MNKKQTIQIVIIVVVFLGAGIILYYGGIFGTSGSLGRVLIPTISPTPATAVTAGRDILPSGDPLNFSKAIYPNRFQYNIIEYPKVDAKSEIGVNVYDLVTQ